MILRRVANSLAFRSGPAARSVVSRLPIRSRGQYRPAGFRLMTLVGARQLELLRECLRSAAECWSVRPELEIVTDGTVSTPKVLQAFPWWGATITVRQPEDVARAAELAGWHEGAEFTRKTVLGIKFCAVVLSARERPTLFCDTDILWYRDIDVGAAPSGKSLAFTMAHDYQPAYNQAVALAMGFDSSRPPFRNSGLVFLDGNLLSEVELGTGIRAAIDSYDHFAEQTLFAAASASLGAELWQPSTIACSNADQQSLGITYRGQDWTARHYVGTVRHLFWRDALAQRFGVRP